MLVVVLGACGPGGSSTPRASVTTTGATASATGLDHDCITPGSGSPDVAWSQLRNPILSDPVAGEKDQALVWAGGRWHMLFSYVTNSVPTPGAQYWNIATADSPDLDQWTAPSPWPPQPGVIGVASPDIVRSPSGLFVATYDSGPGEVGGGQAKLYYRTSVDLETWSAARPLALGLHPSPGARMIDPSLAWTGNGLILGYKYGLATSATSQHFEVAWSPSGSIDGPWHLVGRPDVVVYGDTVENLEFVAVAGRWRLVATSNTGDQPWMFELAGDPRTPSSWLHWVHGSELRVPGQAWDTGPGISSVNYEHANSVFLCDAHGPDGYYYVTYAGSSELTQFGGWGHAEIGIARSTDLVHWSVPG
ncbi:MAG TPA: hypothetical protein VN768_00335 [Acidimicrobiales bacterium]|nr:hypothetical protein [Acidimicrobiales bacterium]